MEDSKNKQSVKSDKNTNCNAESESIAFKSKEEADDDLDDILDSALEDFDKSTPVASNPPEEQNHSSSTPSNVPNVSGASAFPTQDDMFNNVFADADQSRQFEDMMKALMGNDPNMVQNIEKLATAAAQSGSSEDSNKTFEKTLQETVNSMTENTEQLQNDLPEEELMKMLGGLGLGGEGMSGFGLGAEGGLGAMGPGGDPGGMGDFMPMMQTMMKSILSKDVLYPSIKDVATKYPKYLEDNKDKLSEKDIATYTKQYELMNEICVEFERESDSDSQSVKDARLEKIMDLMEKMRELGTPPSELVGEMPPGFDANMFGGMPSPTDQCSVM